MNVLSSHFNWHHSRYSVKVALLDFMFSFRSNLFQQCPDSWGLHLILEFSLALVCSYHQLELVEWEHHQHSTMLQKVYCERNACAVSGAIRGKNPRFRFSGFQLISPFLGIKCPANGPLNSQTIYTFTFLVIAKQFHFPILPSKWTKAKCQSEKAKLSQEKEKVTKGGEVSSVS